MPPSAHIDIASASFIGNADAVGLLWRSVTAGRAAHAYLVTGPRGVGRRTLATQLAQAMNCLADPSEQPCGTCRQCRLIERGVHPDVHVIKRAPDRREILLREPRTPSQPAGSGNVSDNVEFIQSDAQLRPMDGRRKVYLILSAEELGSDAANRLLKTLEEPTSHVSFVLTASDRGAVMATIVSRCQEVRLRPVPRQEIAAALVQRGLADPERAAEVAALAGGAPGWALAAAKDPSVYELYQADVRELREALSADRLERLLRARALSERWSSHADQVRTTLRTWLAWWRDVLLVQAGVPERIAHTRPDDRAALATVAAQVSGEAARATQALIRRTLADLDANVNARLALDLLLLRLPHTLQR